jgi:hypothetical protein
MPPTLMGCTTNFSLSIDAEVSCGESDDKLKFVLHKNLEAQPLKIKSMTPKAEGFRISGGIAATQGSCKSCQPLRAREHLKADPNISRKLSFTGERFAIFKERYV